MISWILFKVLLVTMVVGGFFFPWLAHVPGLMVLAWIIFGPIKVVIQKDKPSE
jgi:hypothetical protein